MNKIWANFSPVFRRFLISYLIVLIIPLIAGYASYRASIDVAETSSIENSRMTLMLSKEILERRLVEVEGFTKQLAINEELYRLIAGPKTVDVNNVFGIGRMQRSLSNFSRTNDYLANFFIYIRNYNVIITPGSVFYRPEHYFELNHYDGMTFTQWKKTILEKTHQNEILPQHVYRNDTRDYSAVTVLQSLPLNSFNNPQATVAVMIDESKMGSLLDNITAQYDGWAFITDSTGRTIISQGIDKAEINNLTGIPSGTPGDTSRLQDGRLLISIRSDLNGWLYTAGIPEKALMGKANTIKQVTGTFTVSASIIGLLIGLLLAYRNSAPIHRLLSVFREQNGFMTGNAKNEYDFLAGNISNLIANNKLLETELNDQLPLLRDAFIKRLLVGEFYSLREIQAVSSQTGIEMAGDRGYVGILKINGYGGMESEEIIQELSVARLIVKQALLEMNASFLISDWGSDKIAVVFPQDNEASDNQIRVTEEELLKLLDALYSQYRLSINIGMGSKYMVLHDVSRSFNEAQQALEYAIYIGSAGITRYQDTIRETAMYYYPIDSEQRLINTMRAGEYEEGRRILEQLFTRNFEERELSYEMSQQFIIEIKGTLLKLTEQKIFHDEALADDIKNRIVQIQPTEGVAQLKNKFEMLLWEICGDIAKKKSDSHNETIKAIMRFVEGAYNDPDLTLYRFAEQIGRPEKYISHLFKEHTGENLSDYVELVRMNKAAELLLENRLTIDEIAVHVGYNSAHSFRRAFKRVKGVSPSAFRNSAD